MQVLTTSTLLFSIAALSFGAMIPADAPEGLYISTVDESGKETMKYHGLNGTLESGSDVAIAAREFLSSRAAGPDVDILEKRNGVSCGPYTGLNYDSAVGSLANWCGGGQAFSGSAAFYSNGAVAYACDYGNGNRCDSGNVWGYNGAVSSKCGPNGNGWYNIDAYALSFGRTQTGTCYCWC